MMCLTNPLLSSYQGLKTLLHHYTVSTNHFQRILYTSSYLPTLRSHKFAGFRNQSRFLRVQPLKKCDIQGVCVQDRKQQI